MDELLVLVAGVVVHDFPGTGVVVVEEGASEMLELGEVLTLWTTPVPGRWGCTRSLVGDPGASGGVENGGQQHPLDGLFEQEALWRLPVSEHARSLLPAVVEFPLGNAADLALVSGRDHSNVYPRWWELHGAGLVGCESLGATRGWSTRWWGTQKGLDEIRLGGLAWQQPWALSQLLARLPPVEWFYQVAGSITSMGALQSFQWFTGVSWDAAVRYERGWAAFFWSGLPQVAVRLRQVLADLAEDLREYSVGPDAAWPGLLVFVGADGGSGS